MYNTLYKNNTEVFGCQAGGWALSNKVQCQISKL